jgi:hypothetical protein
MNKLEIYGVLLLLIIASITGAYFKGAHDKEHSLATEQLAANAKALQESTLALQARAKADDEARAASEAFTARMKQGLADVNARFAKLPNVVVDAHGCPDLGDNFRLRWNAVTGLLGTFGPSPGKPDGPVPLQPVPAPR